MFLVAFFVEIRGISMINLYKQQQYTSLLTATQYVQFSTNVHSVIFVTSVKLEACILYVAYV